MEDEKLTEHIGEGNTQRFEEKDQHEREGERGEERGGTAYRSQVSVLSLRFCVTWLTTFCTIGYTRRMRSRVEKQLSSLDFRNNSTFFSSNYWESKHTRCHSERSRVCACVWLLKHRPVEGHPRLWEVRICVALL